MNKKLKLAGAASALALAGGVFLVAPAQAVDIEKQGNCSMGSVFQAEIDLEYNVWDLSFEVNTRTADQTWRLIVNQNGKRVSNVRAQAIKDWDDNYSEVEWDLIRPNRAGTDRFFMSAKNLTTGEVCKVTLRG